MKQHGFTLLEIMLVLVISSILSGILYSCLFQTQKIVNTIDGISSVYMRAIIVQRQMMRDLAGICVPPSLLEPPKQKKEELLQGDEKPQQQELPQQQKSPEEQRQELKQRLSELFNATIVDGQLGSLRCMTNNPLDIFWSKSSGRPKPRLESVQYRLEKMKEKSESLYRLMRKTSYISSDQTAQKTVEHELINNITSLKLQYDIFIMPDVEHMGAEKENVQQQLQEIEERTQEKPKMHIKTFNDWVFSDMDEQDERIHFQLPHYITITIAIFNHNKKRSEEFMFTVPVAWKPFAAQEKKAEQERKKHLEAQKKQQETQEQEKAKAQQEEQSSRPARDKRRAAR